MTKTRTVRSKPAEMPVGVKTLIESVKLEDVHLVETRASFHEDRFRLDQPGGFQVRVRPAQYRGTYSPEVNMLYCGVRFQLEVFTGEGTEKPTIEVFAEYSLLYSTDKPIDCSKDDAKTFAGLNAVFNAWPFFREHVHGLTAKMGVLPIIVPLHRLPLTAPK